MPNSPSEETYAYLAGIVDADGTISAVRPRNGSGFGVRIGVHQAEPDAVELLAATFGGEVKRRPSYTDLGTRDTFLWYTTAGNLVPALERLLPHLRQKRKQAEIALEVDRVNRSWHSAGTYRRPADVTERLAELCDELATANAFGRRTTDTPIPAPPATPDRDIPPAAAAYLAGVLDADGHFRARRQEIRGDVRYPVEVKLKQVTDDSIKLLQHHFGIKVRVEAPSIEGGRALLNWSCSAVTARALIESVLPYLLIKHDRAAVCLRVIELNAAPMQPLEVPEVQDGEALIPLAEAAALAGVTYNGAAASVRKGRVPAVRLPRTSKNGPVVFIPESFIPLWKARDHRRRSAEHRAELDALVAESKRLNSR